MRMLFGRSLAVMAGSLLLLLMPLASHASSEIRKVINERYGAVISEQKLAVGGLTGWVVKTKAGNEVTLYTTEDGQAIIAGTVFELSTKKPVGNSLVRSKASKIHQDVAPEADPSKSYAFGGQKPAQMPESMVLLDRLSGIKEGSGDVANTLYIIIDPRCPYCHEVYARTRPYVAKGHSIKWIPAPALGDQEKGMALVAGMLGARDKLKTLDEVMGKKKQVMGVPTKEIKEHALDNFAFLLAAFEQSGEEQVGVPTGFFYDRRTQRPRMMQALTKSDVLLDIFGE